MKKLIWILLLGVLVIAGGLAIFYSTFDLFPTEEVFLESFTDADRNHYRVVNIPSNATTESVIQIRRLTANNDYELVEVLEGYTEFSLIGAVTSDTLTFVVWDKQRETERDTLQVEL